MNLSEIITVVEAITKLVEALKGIGLDVSQIKIATAQPIALPGNILDLFSLLKPKA